jgi:5-methylcytosine-specific restriction endonuclease McrA
MYVPGARTRGKPPQRFCSKGCANWERNKARSANRAEPGVPYYQTERGRTVALAKARKRRLLLAAAEWDGVTDAEILERDGWVCQLCEEPIDQALRYPDQRSRSIDHVVPLTLGGDDTAPNKQAAHLGCNISKGGQAPGAAHETGCVAQRALVRMSRGMRGRQTAAGGG